MDSINESINSPNETSSYILDRNLFINGQELNYDQSL